MSDTAQPAAPAPAPTEAVDTSADTTQDTGAATPTEASNAANIQAKAAAGEKLTKAEQKTLKKLKLKVDGQEFDEELPFEIPDTPEAIEYARKNLQMAKAAGKRMQEKAMMEKEVMQFLEDLRKNPRKVLQDPRIGLDLKKLAQEVIETEIENSKKSPEQLALEKAQQELKELKEQQERAQQEAKQREFERLKEEQYERYDMLMSQALDKAELPKSPYYVKKMADYMLIGLENGIDVSPEDVVPIVQEEALEDFRQLLAVLPLDKAEKLIGKDIINTIRKKNISKAKQAASNPAVKAPTKTADTGKKAEVKQDGQKKTIKQLFGI